jgi:hypothetical protein
LPADDVFTPGTHAVLSGIYTEPEDMVPVESARWIVILKPVELSVLAVRILEVAASTAGVMLPKASVDPSNEKYKYPPEDASVACGYAVYE